MELHLKLRVYELQEFALQLPKLVKEPPDERSPLVIVVTSLSYFHSRYKKADNEPILLAFIGSLTISSAKDD